MIVLGPGVVVPEAELEWRTSRAGGPGGQHVNRTESRVELWWDLRGSPSISENVRARLERAFESRLTTDGRLRVVAASERSQSRNRDEALSRLKEMVAAALKPRRKRVATRPTKGSQRRRLDAKKRDGAIKKLRRKPPID